MDIGGHHGRRFVSCAALTGRRGGHTPFVQAGGRFSQTQALLGRVAAGVGDEKAQSCGVVRPLRISLVIRQERRTYVDIVR